MQENNIWVKWAVELQFLAQCGLSYSENVFQKERFQRVREIAAEILAYKTDISTEKVKAMFCNESGYQTPKVSTRAAVFENGKILLVQENNGLWSMPGGWCDVDQSVGSNTVKEVLEETGMSVKTERLLAVVDRNRRNKPISPYGHIKFIVECTYISGSFVSNEETLACDFFDVSSLPPLDERKITKDEIEMCLKAHNNPNHQTIFD